MHLPRLRESAIAGSTKENAPQVKTVRGSTTKQRKVKGRVRAKEKISGVVPPAVDAEAPQIKTHKAIALRRQAPIDPSTDSKNAAFSKKVPVVTEQTVLTDTLKCADTMPKVHARKVKNVNLRT